MKHKLRVYGLTPKEIKRIRVVVSQLAEGVYDLYVDLPGRGWEFTSSGSDGTYNCIVVFSYQPSSNDSYENGKSEEEKEREEDKTIVVELALPQPTESYGGCVVGNVMKDYFRGIYTDSEKYSKSPVVFSKNKFRIKSQPAI